eukprot:5397260-Lingulodinium_polyedra.AAC.1
MGLEVLDSGPCCWKLEENGEVVAIICAHVDDFLFAGDETSPAWKACRERIKKEFKWGEWESGEFSQCGVDVMQAADMSIEIKQQDYLYQ